MGRMFQLRPTNQSFLAGHLVDILGDIGSHSMLERPECTLTIFRPRAMCRAYTRPWIHVLDMGAFKPGEISVKVAHDTISVQAKHEVSDGENIDIIQRKRCVKIPKDVNVKKIACFLDRFGKFVIQAPFSLKKHSADTTEGVPKKMEDTAECRDAEDKVCENPPAVIYKDTCENSDKKKEVETLHEVEDEAIVHKIERKQHNSTTDESADYTELKETDDNNCLTKHDSIKTSQETVLDDQKFGDQLQDDDQQKDIESTKNTSILKAHTDSMDDTGNEKQDYFNVKLDVSQFQAGDVSVKFKEGGLCIDATRESEQDGLKEYQEFHRRFQLPKSASDENASARINEDGLLTVKIPLTTATHTE